ncbi:MAG: hypothetical protein ABGX27_06570 [Desulfurobacteriaceae bacterium]
MRLVLTIIVLTFITSFKVFGFEVKFPGGLSIEEATKLLKSEKILNILKEEKRVSEEEAISQLERFRKTKDTDIEKYKKNLRKLKVLIATYDIPEDAKLENIDKYISQALFKEEEDFYLPVCVLTYLRTEDNPTEILPKLDVSKIVETLGVENIEKKVKLTLENRSRNYQFFIKNYKFGTATLKQRILIKPFFDESSQKIITGTVYYFYPFKRENKSLILGEREKREDLDTFSVIVSGKDSIETFLDKVKGKGILFNINDKTLLDNPYCKEYEEKLKEYREKILQIRRESSYQTKRIEKLLVSFPQCDTVGCLIENMEKEVENEKRKEKFFIPTPQKGEFLSVDLAYRNFLDSLIKEIKNLQITFKESKVITRETFSKTKKEEELPVVITYIKLIPFYTKNGKIGLASIFGFRPFTSKKIVLSLGKEKLVFIPIGDHRYLLSEELNYNVLKSLGIDLENKCLRNFLERLKSIYGEKVSSLPVTCLDRTAIEKILSSLNERFGGKYLFRLPKCEELKKVAQRESEEGITCSCLQEGCSVNFSRGFPVPTKEGTPDSWGFYYLCGNVSEYCTEDGEILYIGGNYDSDREDIFREYQGFKRPWVGLRLIMEEKTKRK